ncbi:MAG: aminoacyl-tRNA hydrolase [Lachnospiraceae bacterium]|nr:aminoacyl-tRNA hydrolase [Lachnospiraceae bacterium]
MYMIAGLGNPGRKYEKTRHNTGFEALDRIASHAGAAINMHKFEADYGTAVIGGQKVLLVKPQTYMNNSGIAIGGLAGFYKIEPENIIIICDDINLPAGQLRIRPRGSAGGHNGLKSIISHLGSEEFPRIRIGIGQKPEGWDLADYVLAKRPQEEQALMDAAYGETLEAAHLIVSGETVKAMNTFNVKKKPDSEGEA